MIQSTIRAIPNMSVRLIAFELSVRHKLIEDYGLSPIRFDHDWFGQTVLRLFLQGQDPSVTAFTLANTREGHYYH
jgi:hypothetical protein